MDTQAQPQAIEDPNFVIKEVSYSFRKTELEDAANPGKKIEFKREAFKTPLKLMTRAGILSALAGNNAKVHDLICDQVNSSIIEVARGQINTALDSVPDASFSSFVLNQEVINHAGLTLEAIANMPKGERGGIPKEQMLAFVKDYSEAMQTPKAAELLGFTMEANRIAIHGRVLETKFQNIRARDDLLKQMRGYMDIYVQVANERGSLEDQKQVYEVLSKKLDDFMGQEQIDAL